MRKSEKTTFQWPKVSKLLITLPRHKPDFRTGLRFSFRAPEVLAQSLYLITPTSVQNQSTSKLPPNFTIRLSQVKVVRQEKLFWAAAEVKCREMGGHLASVTSNDTHDYLTMNVSSFQISSTITFVYQEKNIRSIWVGGTDQFKERNWTWTDCSPWNFTRWGVRQGHEQPDNSNHKDGEGEDCVLFPGSKASNIDWADDACNLKERQFVCSKPVCYPGMTH